MAYYLLGQFRKVLHILLRETLARRQDYALAGMDAQRVEILHVADGNAAVGSIAHDFELYLLPSLERLLDEHLRGEGKSLGTELLELGVVVDEAGAEAAEGIGGAKNERIAEVARGGPGLFEAFGRVRLDGEYVYFVEALDEQFAVFRVHDGLYRRAQHLDAVLLKDSAAIQVDAAIKRRLAPERKEYALRPLLRYDFLYEERGNGQEVYPVRYTFGGLYGRDVGVDQDRFHPILAQGLQGLRSRVVEFSCLADLKCTGSEQENLLDR